MSASCRTSEASRPDVGESHEPDARRHRQHPARAQLHRSRKDGAQFLGPLQRRVGVGDVGLEGGELVAVQPAQADYVGHGGAQSFGHGQEDLVAHGMAEGVVDAT